MLRLGFSVSVSLALLGFLDLKMRMVIQDGRMDG